MKTLKLLAPFLFSVFIITNSYAQMKPKNADEVIRQATAEAAKTNKNIFVIFHASWCIWCHRMDTAMNDKTINLFFDKNYVIKHLTVDESKYKRNLENLGAAALRTKYYGDQQGIPYWFILDKKGKLLADSRLHSDDGEVTGNNVGCPVKPDEVDYFIDVLKKTSALTNAQLEMIRKRFLKIGE
jgi:thioredoxin-related protein